MWIDRHGSEVLAPPECRRLLAAAAARGAIGHLAVRAAGAPIVLPVNFAYADSSVILVLAPGLLWDQARGTAVAFEVDAVDADAGHAWSVLIRGLASEHDPTRDEPLSSLPAPLAPQPGHNVLVVRPEVVTGRRFALAHVDDAAAPSGPSVRASTAPGTGC